MNVRCHFKILQNETKIGQAVLETFKLKDRGLEILREKTTEKLKMLFYGGVAQNEEQ